MKSTLLIGGDGREYSKVAIKTIIQMCPARKVAKVILGKDGLLSTPAASYLIQKHKAVCGFILTTSMAHSGSASYFGIKINGSDGGPAPEAIFSKIERLTKKIENYKICKEVNPDITVVAAQQYTTDYGHFTVDVIDPVKVTGAYSDSFQCIYVRHNDLNQHTLSTLSLRDPSLIEKYYSESIL
ncbi:hypothetical protein NP493_483g00016 [Ridgeia piscesae]|uniref:Alpha-D-phosphohexomutase alpha/beta/alpha domain-containing protein n=1 Tax=Ridgeia piscesae TaxID=27915 RepID=A0AAD9KZ42_RIDPI|nr:hypothetical protein NP493_483g00016 [Ridgeia piscesae]